MIILLLKISFLTLPICEIIVVIVQSHMGDVYCLYYHNNTVNKSSQVCSLCTLFLKKLIKDADFPPFLHTTDCDKFDENKPHVIINI